MLIRNTLLVTAMSVYHNCVWLQKRNLQKKKQFKRKTESSTIFETDIQAETGTYFFA